DHPCDPESRRFDPRNEQVLPRAVLCIAVGGDGDTNDGDGGDNDDIVNGDDGGDNGGDNGDGDGDGDGDSDGDGDFPLLRGGASISLAIATSIDGGRENGARTVFLSVRVISGPLGFNLYRRRSGIYPQGWMTGADIAGGAGAA
ncbi:hypothetical protein Tco_1305849, partial [Tanacetum coccineum]